MADGSRIGVVTGLTAEAATLDPGAFRIRVSAANPARAARAADALIAGGARLLVSYGLAAGLDPRLGPGAVLLPEAVIPQEGPVETPDPGGVRDQLQRLAAFRRDDAAGRLPEPPPASDYLAADSASRESLCDGLGEQTHDGVIAGVDEPIMRADQKLALFARTRAVGADMESHVVARAARAAGIPFVVLRVVGDPSNRAIPQCALAGLTEDGRLAGWVIASGLLWRPWECVDLLTLALDAAQAMRRLRRVGRRMALLLAGF